MRKNVILCFVALCFSLSVAAQDHLLREDTAARLVDRYYDILNYEQMPTDSMLLIETTAYIHGGHDTFQITRWHVAPLMMRVEVRRDGVLQTGMCTNGRDRYRVFRPTDGYWIDVPEHVFYEAMVGYDYRGQLYGWRALGASLTYIGRVHARDGRYVHNVYVEMPGQYARYYMFEESGLLSVIIGTDQIDTVEYSHGDNLRSDWRIIHEYMQVGQQILPKEESFLRKGMVTVMQSDARYVKRDDLIFNIDNR